MNGKREFTGSYSLTYISLLMPMVSVSSKCTTKKNSTGMGMEIGSHVCC